MSGPQNGIKPTRVKLRRTYQQHQLIEKNLQNLESSSFKKKYAQQKYYGRIVKKENFGGKMPVHARLGIRQINLRRGAYQFLNNGFIDKRVALRRRLGRRRPAGSSNLQNRLNLIRNGPPKNHHQRILDYTIQIKNNLPPSENYMAIRHSCKAQLNTQLQNEINLIQNEAENKTEQIILSQPIHVVGYGFTNVSLHQRFSV